MQMPDGISDSRAFGVSAWAKLVQGTAEAEGLEATVRPLDFLALLVRGFTLFFSFLGIQLLRIRTFLSL